jgi:hypothetical protein
VLTDGFSFLQKNTMIRYLLDELWASEHSYGDAMGPGGPRRDPRLQYPEAALLTRGEGQLLRREMENVTTLVPNSIREVLVEMMPSLAEGLGELNVYSPAWQMGT